MSSIFSSLYLFAAQSCVNTTLFGEVCDSCDGGAIIKILAFVIQFLTYGVAAVGVLGIVIAGIQYLTASGNEAQMTKAKNRIVQVVIGLLSYGLMFTFLQFIIPGGVIRSTLDSSTSSCPEPTQQAQGTPTQPVSPSDTNPQSDSSSTSDPTPQQTQTQTFNRSCGPEVPGTLGSITTASDGITDKYTTTSGRVYYVFKQGDSRWASLQANTQTMRQNGCLRTSLATVFNSYGINMTPADIAGAGGTYIAGEVESRASSVLRYGGEASSNFAREIKDTLAAGGSVVVRVRAYYTTSQHHMPIVDYRVKNGKEQVFIANTYNSTSGSKNGWVDLDTLISQGAMDRVYKFLPKSNVSCLAASQQQTDQTSQAGQSDQSPQSEQTHSDLPYRMAQQAVNVAWPYTSGPNAGKCINAAGQLVAWNSRKVFGDDTNYCNYGLKPENEELYKTAYNKDRISDSYFRSHVQDCSYFIRALLIYMGVDTKDNISSSPSGIGRYLSRKAADANPTWVEIPNQQSTANLRPGDIFVNSTHIMIYVGSELGGGFGDMVGASARTWPARIHNTYFTSKSGSGEKFRIFRYIGA